VNSTTLFSGSKLTSTQPVGTSSATTNTGNRSTLLFGLFALRAFNGEVLEVVVGSERCEEA
jgi:hypothetical protein